MGRVLYLLMGALLNTLTGIQRGFHTAQILYAK
jgi:hypothetical protein